ncbi:MAG: enoyl-CoA hydratase/isomerase family protein [Rhodomicrobium sp.]
MDQAGNDIVTAIEGRAAIVRLSRPKALNAVTFEMIRELEALCHRFARDPHIYAILMEAEGKAFSAGGDIRTIRDWIRNDLPQADRFYAVEYQHNWSLQCLRRRHIALMNGIAMGGGVGISIFGTHRVAGEKMAFAMPETGIGFFPDIGGGWFLPRMPGMAGMYLGLTGRICGRADAYYAGAVTHCIPEAKFETVKAAVIEAEPIDPILDGLHEPPGESYLEKHSEPVGRIFSAPSLEEILRRLENERGTWQDFAGETLAALSKKSPLSLKVAFEQLRRGKSYRTLKEALIVEYRLATRLIRMHNFSEGIRAVIVDKDQSPKWQPASLSEVSDAFVQSLFEPLPGGDLKLIDYWVPPLNG